METALIYKNVALHYGGINPLSMALFFFIAFYLISTGRRNNQAVQAPVEGEHG